MNTFLANKYYDIFGLGHSNEFLPSEILPIWDTIKHDIRFCSNENSPLIFSLYLFSRFSSLSAIKQQQQQQKHNGLSM